MTLTRNYLTGEELAVIVNEMLKKDNAIERHIICVGLTLQMLVEDLAEYEDNTDLYDAYMAQNDIVLEEAIKNYSMIEKLVKDELGAEKAVSDFLSELNAKLDKSFKKLPKDLKNFKMEDLVNQLKEVMDSGVQ